MIRLFAGIELPEDIKDQLYALRGGVPNAKWVERDNLHITLRFIGNIDEDVAADLHEGFMQIKAPAFAGRIFRHRFAAASPVGGRLQLSGFGLFARQDRKRRFTQPSAARQTQIPRALHAGQAVRRGHRGRAEIFGIQQPV